MNYIMYLDIVIVSLLGIAYVLGFLPYKWSKVIITVSLVSMYLKISFSNDTQNDQTESVNKDL